LSLFALILAGLPKVFARNETYSQKRKKVKAIKKESYLSGNTHKKRG
tara:strand:- start:156 stop:296 length:141 start_codon:yes stop_codon:yes gene_type:complete